MSTGARSTVRFTVLLVMLSPFLLRSSDQTGKGETRERRAGRVLGVRIGVETLRNPYWYAAQGHQAEAEQFWEKAHWDRVLRGWAAEGYNYVLYWVEPWNKHAWQTFLIRHTAYPE